MGCRWEAERFRWDPVGSGGIRWEPPAELRLLQTLTTPCRLYKSPKATEKPVMSMRHLSSAHLLVVKQVIAEKSICNATGQSIPSTNRSNVQIVSGNSAGGKTGLGCRIISSARTAHSDC